MVVVLIYIAVCAALVAFFWDDLKDPYDPRFADPVPESLGEMAPLIVQLETVAEALRVRPREVGVPEAAYWSVRDVIETLRRRGSLR